MKVPMMWMKAAKEGPRESLEGSEWFTITMPIRAAILQAHLGFSPTIIFFNDILKKGAIVVRTISHHF
jgi:hypothetical protein